MKTVREFAFYYIVGVVIGAVVMLVRGLEVF